MGPMDGPYRSEWEVPATVDGPYRSEWDDLKPATTFGTGPWCNARRRLGAVDQRISNLMTT